VQFTEILPGSFACVGASNDAEISSSKALKLASRGRTVRLHSSDGIRTGATASQAAETSGWCDALGI